MVNGYVNAAHDTSAQVHVTVTGAPTLNLNDGAKATYTSGSGKRHWYTPPPYSRQKDSGMEAEADLRPLRFYVR